MAAMLTRPTPISVATEPAGDAPQQVPGNLPCRCGYNLRGLPAGGLCPECARPVALAMAAAPTVDVRWARHVASGIVILTCLYLLPLLWPFAVWRLGAANHLASSIVAGVCLVGVWLISRLEPGASARTAHRLSRALLRAAAVLWVLTETSASVLQLGPSANYVELFTTANLSGMATVFGVYARYAALARQLESVALRWWSLGLGLCMGVVLFIPDWVITLDRLSSITNYGGWIAQSLFAGICGGLVAAFIAGRLHQRLLTAAGR